MSAPHIPTGIRTPAQWSKESMARPDDFSRTLTRFAGPVPVRTDEDEIDALAIFRLMRRRVWIILAITACVIGAALPPIMAMPPLYTAASRLLIHVPLAARLNADEKDNLLRLNLTTEVERLLAYDTSMRVVRQLSLDQLPEFNPALRPETFTNRLRREVGEALGIYRQAVDSKGAADRALPDYYAALRVARDPQSDLVSISFTSVDPSLAAKVPNVLLHTYLEERESHLNRQVQGADNWIGQRIGEQKERLAAAELALRRFEEANVAAGEAQAANLQTIASLNAQRTELAQKRAELRAVLSAMQAATSPEGRIALVDTASASDLSRELHLAKQELNSKLAVYGPNSAEIAAAQTKLNTAAAAVDSEVDRFTRLLETRLLGVARSDLDAKARLDAARLALSRHEAMQNERENLRREAATEQAALDRLEGERRFLWAQSKLPVADVEMLAPATLPVAPSSRGRLIYAMIALAVGVMLGLTAAAVLELLDGSVRSAQQLPDDAGLFSTTMVSVQPRAVARQLKNGERQRPIGALGEGIRSIVLSLEQLGGGQMPNSVLVTSALPGEGKSFLAVALALELGARGRRVLLVDGDLRRGRVHTLFGASPSPGLTELIHQAVQVDTAVRHDPVSGIDYVARGAAAPRLPLEREPLEQILRTAAANQQIVVFDSPPALVSADTILLASMAECSLLAVRWGRTSRKAVGTALAALRNGRGKKLLCAINMVNPRRHRLYGFRDSELYTKALRRYYPV